MLYMVVCGLKPLASDWLRAVHCVTMRTTVILFLVLKKREEISRNHAGMSM